MIFVEFVGTEDVFRAIGEPVGQEMARVLRVRPESVTIRRVVTQGGGDAAELWVELSSEEQVFRRGREIAEALAKVAKQHIETDLWVMFRVVPLSHAFLNGRPRARGRASGEPSSE